jgi:hypothetical protein
MNRIRDSGGDFDNVAKYQVVAWHKTAGPPLYSDNYGAYP